MMGLDWQALVGLVLLGGVVAVDGTSFGQFMVSRPLVAASLAGFVVGQPMAGAAIGLILEAFHLGVLPVGAAKYPEGGPPAVAAAAVYAASDQTATSLLLIILTALLLEWVSGESVRALRQANVRLVPTNADGHWSAEHLEWRHLAAVALDFVRGCVVVSIAATVLVGVVQILAPRWALGEPVAEILLAACVVGMLSSAFRVVGSRAWLALAGALCGAMFLLLSR